MQEKHTIPHSEIVSHAGAWQDAEEGEVASLVMAYVSAVEQNQSDVFDRFVKLDYLYDPNSHSDGIDSRSMLMDQMSENVIASNVDTVTATVTSQDIRPRMVTDDGDWSVQRNAAALSHYAEGIAKQLMISEKCRRGFHASALKGIGLNKVFTNSFGEICVEPTMIDDIVVDESEVRAGKPRQMHQRMLVDREVLKSEFPEHEGEIESAQRSGSHSDWSYWADYRPVGNEEVVCIESWYLPIGKKGKKGYKPGRHTIVIDGFDLLDEKYHDKFFPFARMAWIERTRGYYAIGLAERIVGHQRELNRLNWTEGRILEQNALPTTYVRPPDANLTIKRSNRLGRIVVVKADIPQTITPSPLSPQLLQRRHEVKGSSFEESGVSRMAAASVKPGGIDSAVGLREYRDQSTQRFSQQEKAYEQFYLDTVWLVLHQCKALGKAAPVVSRKSRWGPKKIQWSDIETEEVKVQLVAASTLGKTPAGRSALALEMAQAGLISSDMLRRVLMPNSPLDVEHEMSLHAAALESTDEAIENLLDGEIVVPEPYQNHAMCVWRGQMRYLKVRSGGAPEQILEALRQFIVQAAYLVSQAQMPPANAEGGPMPGAEAGPLPEGAMPPEMLTA